MSEPADDFLVEWMSDALSEIAGIDTHDVSLRDHPAAYEALGVLLGKVVELSVKALELKHAPPWRDRAALATSTANPWRRAIDDALVSAGLDCLAPDADPRESVKRLVEWSETMALDPAISERARALAARKPLTEAQIEQGRRDTFSTENPFCPCDSKTMRKAVRWAERAHGIKDTNG